MEYAYGDGFAGGLPEEGRGEPMAEEEGMMALAPDDYYLSYEYTSMETDVSIKIQCTLYYSS